MIVAILALRWAVAAHLTWLAGGLVFGRPRTPAAFAFAAFCLGVVCHLIAPVLLPGAPPGTAGLLLLWGTLTPAPLLWLLSVLLFNDSPRPRPLYAAVVAAAATLSLFAVLLREGVLGLAPPATLLPFLPFLPQAGLLGFVLAALFQIARGYRSDLVEWRIRLRFFLLLGIGALVLGVVLVELYFRQGAAPQELELLKLVLILGLSWAGAWWLFSLRPGLLDDAGPSPGKESTGPTPDPEAARLRTSLEALVRERRIHTEEGLTIGGLARELGAQEYRLRRVINGEMGFRNFNQFLNRHRIADAKQMLADPQFAGYPIVRIAYDLGYGSLAPFNTAFKAETGTTPTGFRKAP